MGKMLVKCAPDFGYEITGGFDVAPHPDIPTFDDVRAADVPFDVIIDFSRPQTLTPLIALAEMRRVPCVIATTGYNDSELMSIRMLAKRIPVFRSGNTSLGIAATKAAAKAAQAILGDAFDIEIVEKHHNQKVDSPSGTALLLADALAPRDKQVIDRNGKRKHGELGITSVRGGGAFCEKPRTVCGGRVQSRGFFAHRKARAVRHGRRCRVPIVSDGCRSFLLKQNR